MTHLLEQVGEPAQPTEYQVPGAEVLTPGGMYPLEVGEDGRTLHSKLCRAAFGRYDWSCARCCELMHGAAPRDGWARPFFARKLREVQRRLLFPNEEQGGR